MARVFISHSSRDNEPAARIKAWLSEQGFETPFLDYDKHAGIPPGADWEKTLYREIERSEAIVIIQTPNWLDSKWCFAEFTQARALGKSIFPIIETPTGDTLISPDIQALDLRTDREGGLEQLSSQLTQIALDAQGGFAWDASRPPYPGLLAFQEEDAALYFGRDDDIRRLIERLNARRAQGGAKLIALLGASGSGKSSLLRAGVIPRLKRAGRNWVVLPPMRPQVRPVDELARSLAVACGGDADWRKLRDELNGDNLALALSDIANDLRIKAAANEAQILLPIDQGEELFGAADPDQARRFFEILNVALSSEQSFIAVTAIRSDYLGHLQSAEHLTARFEEFSLGPMPLARITQIIEGPARVAGLGIDEAFVHQAARDAETEDALPLLAFALRELYDRGSDDNYLSLDEYKALGDEKEGLTPLENAVRKAADDVLTEAKPGEEEQTALREAFVPAMVRVNDQGEYVRRPARWDDLPSRSHPLLDRLAKARLLIVSQDGADRMVEVAHEALLRKWPRLRSWLDDAREFLTGKQQLERDLHDWERATEADKTGALLTGLKLNRARGWLSERGHQLTAKERHLIQASIDHAEAEERRKARTRRNITLGWIAAALVLACTTVYSFYLWRDAEEAKVAAENAKDDGNKRQSNAWASESQRAVERGDAGLARLLAGSAMPSTGEDRPVVDAAFGAFWDAIAAKPPTVLRGHKEHLRAVAFSPDGKRLATASGDRTVRLWDTRTGVEVKVLHGPKTVKESAHRTSVAFSADGKLLAASTWEMTVRIWDAKTGELRHELEGHTKPVSSIAFSPDGKRLATASWGGYNNTARLWDTETGEQLKVFRGHKNALRSVVFHPNGRVLATASEDKTARLWDIVTGEQVHEPLRPENFVNAVAFSPDGARLATASKDRTAIIWSVKTAKPRKVLRGHELDVWSVAFSPDGARLATASKDKTAILWDLETDKHRVLRGHELDVWSVAFSPDSKQLATASWDSTARLWNTKTGQALQVLGGHENQVWSVAFSPDGQRLATGSWDKTARLWDTRIGPQATVLPDHAGLVISVAYSPDGQRLATASWPNFASLWDPATNKKIADLVGHTGHSNEMDQIVFSPDGQHLATASGDTTAILWDPQTGAKRKVLRGHKNRVKSVAFSPDGERLATASWDETARVWDTQTGELMARMSGHGKAVASVAFSPDGLRLATGSWDGTARVWDAETGDTTAVLFGHKNDVYSVAFSPDGQRLATASKDHTARLWNAKTGEEQKVLRGHYDSVGLVAFTPDGQRVVTISNDKTARLWDTKTGKPVAVLRGHDDKLYESIAFSADGLRLATTSWDGTARLWDIRSGVEVAVLHGHEGPVHAVAFSSDGQHVVTGSADRTARIWPLSMRQFEHHPLDSGDYALATTPVFPTPMMRVNFAMAMPQPPDWFEPLARATSNAPMADGVDCDQRERVLPEAKQGNARAHQCLARLAERGSTSNDNAPDLEAAFLHHALAARLAGYSEEDESLARFETERRAAIARLMDPSKVVELWREALNWKPTAP